MKGHRTSPRPRFRRGVAIVGGLAVLLLLAAVNGPGRSTPPAGAADVGIQKIKHIIVIMQENRSFDEYFGTFPGADGIPMKSGHPTVCNPDPKLHKCVKPYVDHHNNSSSPPHSTPSSATDVDGGKMDGFIRADRGAECDRPSNDLCGFGPHDVMGYHTKKDIPNYWSYAKHFVLQDHMFEPTASWSLPAHLYMVSGWSAKCANHDAFSCVGTGRIPPDNHYIFPWTDLTYLLHKNNVSWGYYIVSGLEPDCEDDNALSCVQQDQSAATPSIWNPLPYFDTVKQDNQLGNVKSVASFYKAAKQGSLPAVSWISPSNPVSEHPSAGIAQGQAYVTSLVNAVMRGPDWNSTAIFVAWDDWGGFYDHVVPPVVDGQGYGIRVPGMLISPYAKQGAVDHQTLSFDAYLKLIEDRFLGGQRLDPATDGRPDPRPDVRENAGILGNLASEFNFSQTPRKPMLLPVHPHTTLTNTVPFHPNKPSAKAGPPGRATLHWQLPEQDGGDGGSPLTGWVIRPYVGKDAKKAIRLDGGGHKTFVIKGLKHGQKYRFRIAAVNKVGKGFDSALTNAITIR
jgi:phospholipase C